MEYKERNSVAESEFARENAQTPEMGEIVGLEESSSPEAQFKLIIERGIYQLLPENSLFNSLPATHKFEAVRDSMNNYLERVESRFNNVVRIDRAGGEKIRVEEINPLHEKLQLLDFAQTYFLPDELVA